MPDQHVIEGVVGLQGHARLVLPHVGLDGICPRLTGDGDAVVAVEDKVDLSHLVDLDGEYAPHGAELVYFLPATAHAFGAGEEGARKVVVPAHAAYDLVERDGLDAAVDLLPQVQPLAHCLKGKQVGRVVAQEREGVLDEGALVGAVEFSLRFGAYDDCAAARGVNGQLAARGF